MKKIDDEKLIVKNLEHAIAMEFDVYKYSIENIEKTKT
jgi:hypothetical protein